MSPRRKLIVKCSLAALLCAGASAFGAQLFWGPGGAGGNGTWDTTTANWWDGTNNVPWSTGATAVFGGTGGTVTTVFSGLTVGGMIFNTPGYVLPTSGWITVNNSMTVTTNADATFDMTLNGNTNAVLIKDGSGTLTVTGTNFVDAVQVNQGTYRSDDLFFNDVTLANAPGVVVSLIGTSNTVGGLSGGGPAGGVVQPDSATTPLSFSVTSTSNFGGVLRDNAAATLSLRFSGGSTTVQTLTNANTYSGTTTVSGSQTVLSGAGRIANSPSLTVSSFGILRLDNTSTALSNRVANGVPLTLTSGRLELRGHATTAVSESIGALTFSGSSSLLVDQPGSAQTTLTIASFSRSAGGSLDVSGSGRVILGGATLGAGILAPYITSGGIEFATLDGNGAVIPYTGYAGLNSGNLGDNVKVTGGGITTLAASATRHTLNLQNSDVSAQVVQLGGNTLTLAGGAILTSGTSALSLSGGTLVSGSPELLLTTRANLSIDATITDGSGAVALTKKGAGVLTLSGLNAYTGDTTLAEGTLAITSDQSLGTGGKLVFSGGTLKLLADLTTARTFSGASSVDTNGFSLALNGTLPSSISKTGAGTLALQKLPSSVTIKGGAVTVRAATSGSVSMSDGTSIDVTGRLGQLGGSGTFRLELGAGKPATLLIDGVGSGTAKLKIGFDLGSAGSDYLYLGSSSNITGPAGTFSSYAFDFNDLGGAQTGVDYPLVSFGTSSGAPKPTLLTLSLAPEALAEGWRGTFKVTSDQAFVNFTAVPEPTIGAFLLTGAALLGRRGRRRRAR